jgi:hypothetical protein
MVSNILKNLLPPNFTLKTEPADSSQMLRTIQTGRAIPQAVNRWLLTVATRVQARVSSFGTCGGQSDAGAGFLRVLRFSLPTFIAPVAPQSPSSIIWNWYNRPVVAAVPSGLSLNPLRIITHSLMEMRPS